MGLDSLEIILATEEEFSISLSEEECREAYTFGRLLQVVASKLNVIDSPSSTLHAFYVVREYLKSEHSVPWSEISPSKPIAHYPLKCSGRQFIASFLKYIGLPGTVVPLERSRALKCLLTIWVLSCFGVPLFIYGISAGAVLVLSVLCACAGFIFGLLATLPFKESLPKALYYTSDLYRFVYNSPKAGSSYLEIENRLKEVVSNQLDIPMHKITRNSRFVEDLGVG